MADEPVVVNPSIAEWGERPEVYRELVDALNERGIPTKLSDIQVPESGGDVPDLPWMASIGIGAAGYVGAKFLDVIVSEVVRVVARKARLRWARDRKAQVYIYGPDGLPLKSVEVEGQDED